VGSGARVKGGGRAVGDALEKECHSGCQLLLVVFGEIAIPGASNLRAEVVGEWGGDEPPFCTEEGADDLGEVVVMVLRGGPANGPGVLERAVESVEGDFLVQFSFVLGGMLAEGGFMLIHGGIGGDRVVGVSLIKVVVKGVRGVLPPTLFRLGLDLGDPGVDGVEFGGEGLNGAEDGSEGQVEGGGRFRSKGPFPIVVRGRRGRGGREGRPARGGICGRGGKGADGRGGVRIG